MKTKPMKKIKVPETNPMELAKERLDLKQIHPGTLLRYFGRPKENALERVASETGRSPQEITEILNGDRDPTSDIAEPLGRWFGLPARVIELWRLHYDMSVEWFGHKEWLEEARMHLFGIEVFLAHLEDKIKVLKKEGVYVRKLIPPRFRPRRH
jgi:plasmid maintenance system antidote protein VapI